MPDYLWVALAALAGGAVNALAGGGTLITFPALIAAGLPPLLANVTNSVALCPGYLGGTLAQWRDLQGQGARLRWLIPAGLAGGVGGGLLLVASGERLFVRSIPFLILFATGLLALQPLLGRWVHRRLLHRVELRSERWSVLPVALSALYGGYFGAGLGLMMLAALGLTIDDTLARINAIKQVLSLVINVAAVTCFIAITDVHWPLAGVMAVAALLGGALGGALASRVNPAVLRLLMVTLGLGLSLHFLRG